MIVRVRGPGGMVRVTVGIHDCVQGLFAAVAEAMHLQDTFTLTLPGGSDITSDRADAPLSTLGLRNGDMLQLVPRPASLETSGPAANKGTPPMDAVDLALDAQSGLVKRKLDPQFCHHGVGQQCIHCMPLNPWDETVLKGVDPPIKHMSFQSYLRMLCSGPDKGRLVNLVDQDHIIKANCYGHAPWPEGLCTKCAPSAITLQQQKHRHVDYVEFENHGVVDNFINAWRKSGCQRAGYLYGRYEAYSHVPLGVKAVVAAIYEPPQLNEAGGLELLDDEQEELVDEMARQLGLSRVGWIFTDLEPATGGARYKRYDTDNGSATILSAGEVLMMAHLQNRRPNAVMSKYSSSRRFGSKFVTVVVSGDEGNAICTRAYQATNQAMSLERADLLRPSAERQDMMFVKESSDDQYVPDVFYVHKNEYGTEVKSPARPYFPVQYLFVTLESGTRIDGTGHSLFTVLPEPFSIENRGPLGELQNADTLSAHLKKPYPFHNQISDFHLLLHLAQDRAFEIKTVLPPLLEAIKSHNINAIESWRANEQWVTLVSTYSAAEHAGGSLMGSHAMTAVADWQCSTCTLINSPIANVCAVCGTPRTT